jgi:dihydroflavonol-4-reductase
MIFITGATGHIGNVLARMLIERGKTVRALVLPGEDVSALDGLPVELVRGDVLAPETLETAMQGAEEVYHMAGIISILPGLNPMMRRVNVEGTRNMLRAALRSGVKRFVYTSSIHALERPEDGREITEELNFDVHNTAGEYDRTKAEATLAVQEAVKEGLDAVIVCPTGVIGPHDYRGSELGLMLWAWARQRLNLLVDGIFDFVDVRDIALGHILACERGRRGEAYILGGEQVSLARLWAMVRETANCRSQGLILPFGLAEFAAKFSPAYYRLTRQKAQFTEYALKTVNMQNQISHAKASRELGYQPRPMIDSIRDTILWWKGFQPSRVRVTGR